MIIDIDGHPAYAYTGGRPFDPTRPCIVFIHGALHDHSVWTLPSRWFAHHGYSVLAVDQPGHMRSAGPARPSIGSIAQWLLELLARVGASQVTLVGHSMGSLIALEAAAQGGPGIKTLVMVGTAYPMEVSAGLLQAAAERPAQGIETVNAYSISSWASKPGYPGPGFWLHGGNRALMHRVLASNTRENLFLHDFSLCNDYRLGEDVLSKVRAQVHLVLGLRDQMTPPRATDVLRHGLAPRLHTLPCGHAVMQEKPEEFLRVLREITANPGP